MIIVNAFSEGSKYLYNQLGDRHQYSKIYNDYEHRFVRHDSFSPGFILTHHTALALITLIAPLAFEALKFAIENRKEIAEFLSNRVTSIKNFWKGNEITEETIEEKSPSTPSRYTIIKTNIVNFTKANLCAILTSAAVTGLFIFFPEIAPVVYLGYAVLLASHLFKVIQEYKNESKVNVIKHLFAAIVTTSTIGMMLGGIYEVRWHHMSYGLLSMLPNIRALNFFGTCMVVDSMLYWIKPLKDNFDFSNIFENNLLTYILQIGFLGMYEIGTGFLAFNSSDQANPEI